MLKKTIQGIIRSMLLTRLALVSETLHEFNGCLTEFDQRSPSDWRMATRACHAAARSIRAAFRSAARRSRRWQRASIVLSDFQPMSESSWTAIWWNQICCHRPLVSCPAASTCAPPTHTHTEKFKSVCRRHAGGWCAKIRWNVNGVALITYARC